MKDIELRDSVMDALMASAQQSAYDRFEHARLVKRWRAFQAAIEPILQQKVALAMMDTRPFLVYADGTIVRDESSQYGQMYVELMRGYDEMIEQARRSCGL